MQPSASHRIVSKVRGETTTHAITPSGHTVSIVTPVLRSRAYKTQLCRWYERGCCVLGEDCNFAHSIEEIRGRRHLMQQGSTTNEEGLDQSLFLDHLSPQVLFLNANQANEGFFESISERAVGMELERTISGSTVDSVGEVKSDQAEKTLNEDNVRKRRASCPSRDSEALKLFAEAVHVSIEDKLRVLDWTSQKTSMQRTTYSDDCLSSISTGVSESEMFAVGSDVFAATIEGSPLYSCIDDLFGHCSFSSAELSIDLCLVSVGQPIGAYAE